MDDRRKRGDRSQLWHWLRLAKGKAKVDEAQEEGYRQGAKGRSMKRKKKVTGKGQREGR